MPYFTASGEVSGEPITLIAPGTRTAAGSEGARVAGSNDTARLTLNVTAASGTSPTLTVTVEHSADGSTWTTLGSFTAATAVGTQRKVFSGLDQYVRGSWTTGGTTPSFTFSVSGALL